MKCRILFILVFFRCSSPAQSKLISFTSGTIRFDNKDMHINAHGGGMLYNGGIYYWFGEHKVVGGAGNKATFGKDQIDKMNALIFSSQVASVWNNLATKTIYLEACQSGMGWVRLKCQSISLKGIEEIEAVSKVKNEQLKRHFILKLLANAENGKWFSIKAVFIDARYCRNQGDASEDGKPRYVYAPWPPLMATNFRRSGKLWVTIAIINAKSDSDYLKVLR